MKRLILFLFIILAASALATSAGEPEKKPTEKEIKALIDKLVSPNPKPITGDEDPDVAPDYRLPPGFDEEKQKLVRKAISDLKGLGICAFPFLIDRWDDDHFCILISEGINGYFRNQSVGKTCKMIIFDQIQPYGNSAGFAKNDDLKLAWRPSYPYEFLASRADAKKWYEKHKDKSLYEIQLEALDWVIAEEAKNVKEYSDKEREFLKRTRNDLVENKRFIGRMHFYPIDIDN
jgi:hypothetical protein